MTSSGSTQIDHVCKDPSQIRSRPLVAGVEAWTYWGTSVQLTAPPVGPALAKDPSQMPLPWALLHVLAQEQWSLPVVLAPRGRALCIQPSAQACPSRLAGPCLMDRQIAGRPATPLSLSGRPKPLPCPLSPSARKESGMGGPRPGDGGGLWRMWEPPGVHSTQPCHKAVLSDQALPS